MRAILVIIADVFVHEPFQMAFIEHNDMVEKITAVTSHKTFCNAILPRTLKTGPLGFDAKTPNGADNFFIEIAAAVEDQVARGGAVWKSLTQLLNHP
jgi:hypothetical protein